MLSFTFNVVDVLGDYYHTICRRGKLSITNARSWRIAGTWEVMLLAIREQVRAKLRRQETPSAGIVDAQSVKTTEVGGSERGYDGAFEGERAQATFACG